MRLGCDGVCCVGDEDDGMRLLKACPPGGVDGSDGNSLTRQKIGNALVIYRQGGGPWEWGLT
jgi:hypothetical protein